MRRLGSRFGFSAPVLAFATLGLLAGEASALEVMCGEGPASCTLSNDPFQYFECTCDGEPSVGGTGASENPWADFTEAELLEVCEMSLPDACPAGDTDVGSGGGPTDEGTGPVSTTVDNGFGTEGGDPGTGSASEGATDGESTEGGDKGCAVTAARPAEASLLVMIAAVWLRRRRR